MYVSRPPPHWPGPADCIRYLFHNGCSSICPSPGAAGMCQECTGRSIVQYDHRLESHGQSPLHRCWPVALVMIPHQCKTGKPTVYRAGSVSRVALGIGMDERFPWRTSGEARPGGKDFWHGGWTVSVACVQRLLIDSDRTHRRRSARSAGQTKPSEATAYWRLSATSHRPCPGWFLHSGSGMRSRGGTVRDTVVHESGTCSHPG